MQDPTISLIVPCKEPPAIFYNTLNQLTKESGLSLEIFISDGGGLDSKQLPSNPNLRFKSEPDLGQAEAINKGIGQTSGEILGYLNVDDSLFPGALQKVVEFFHQNPNTNVAYGQGVHIDEDGKWLEDYPTQDWDYSALQETCFLCQPAVFWRRQIHDKVGYFNEDLHYALDYEFWLRVGKQFTFKYLEYEYLAKTRLHPMSKTLRFPLKAKWENLLVKQKHNQRVDTNSAFEYCNLSVKEQLDERNDPPTFAKKMLEAMENIENHFQFMDLRTWENGRSQMKEMATVSKNVAVHTKSPPKIAVDLSLFQKGGVHGGIKEALYSLFEEIISANRCNLVFLISNEIESEITEILGTNLKILICNDITSSEEIKNRLAPDILICPLPSLRFHHPDIPLSFLASDLLHIDYPASLTASDKEYRHNLFLAAKEKADLFLTVSKFSRDRLLSVYEIPHRKAWVLPHALPLNRKKPEQPETEKEKTCFLYPANFWEHKNHKTLLIAYKSYLGSTKNPWKLILTGHPNSGNSKEILHLIHTLHLSEFVHFTGYLSNHRYGEVWESTGALIFPSNYEGFGLPLLEAMEWDVPIISADIPSLREVAESAAYFIDQHSPKAISNALIKISQDIEFRKELVAKGRQRAKAFDWKQPAETFANLVVNLLERKVASIK